MLIPDSEMREGYQGPNGCYWADNEEDGCVVNWGKRSLCCPYLRGVQYKGRFYSTTSPEFSSAFGEENIDYNQLFWDCDYE